MEDKTAGDAQPLKLSCSTKVGLVSSCFSHSASFSFFAFVFAFCQVKPGMVIVTDTPILRARQAAAIRQAFSRQATGALRAQNPFHVRDLEDLQLFHSQALIDFDSHAIVRDMALCVDCSRCLRACCDLQGMGVLEPSTEEVRVAVQFR